MRLRIACVLAVIVVLAGAELIRADSPPPLADALREGDLIFHESTSAQSRAIREATSSRFTHVGLVFRRGARWQVLEAVGPVRFTPLESFVARGLRREVAVRRLRDAERRLDVDGVARLRVAAERFLGRPYDPRFRFDDETIYCSELAFKAYERGLGVRIGEPQSFRELALAGPAARSLVRRRMRGRPLVGTVITPARMLDAPEVVPVAVRGAGVW